MWAENPVLLQDSEVGSSEHRTVAYIHAAAAHRKEKDGGVGMLHLPSHAAAFNAQWIRRWLEPGHQPWKLVVDYWVTGEDPYGRARILRGASGESIINAIPRQHHYLRQCFRDFLPLNMTQDTSKLDARVQSEPVLDNPRFEIPALHRNKKKATELKNKWIRTLNLVHMHNLVNDLTDDIITEDEMRGQCYLNVPNPTSPSAHEWVDELMEPWPIIRGALPQDALDATVRAPPPPPNGYLHLEEQNGATMYLRDHESHHTRLFLDVQGTPHDTGETISTFRIMQGTTTPVALWITTPEEEEEDHDYEGDNGGAKHFKRVRICGPINITDPQPDRRHKAPKATS